MYPNFGFITIDPSFQDKHPESKNVRLLFYASNHIQDCVRMHFSNQGVALSYVNTSTESINHFIEVDAELFDGLLKAETVELCKVDSLDRLEATCGTDFTIFSITDYGVKLIDHNYNIVLLGDMQNPSKYQGNC